MYKSRKNRRVESLEARRVLDSTVVFNEIMYHAEKDTPDVEWIELYNQLAVDMDISEWTISGGVDFTFPDETVVPGRGYIVVAYDPNALSNATGYDRSLGPYLGRLDNGGESLRLRNNDGRLMNSIDYGDDKAWPIGPDGSGVSLAKLDQRTASEDVNNWTDSVDVGGTPGEANFFTDGSFITTEIISERAPAKAVVPSRNIGNGWTQVDFDDSAWTTGQTGIGYERGSGYDSLFGLDLADPPNNQAAVPMFEVNESAYVRVPFQITDDLEQFDALTLRMKYDDGFVAYINGVEVARDNAPNNVTWNSGANGSRSDNLATAFADFNVTGAMEMLNQGENILAIHGLNQSLTSSDFLILPELVGTTEISPQEKGGRLPLSFNEIQAADEAEFWVEISNDGENDISLDGIVLQATAEATEFAFGNRTIGAGSSLVVTEAELGFRPDAGERLFMYSADKQQLYDARPVTNRLRGRSELHPQEWLFPSQPTPGATNRFEFENDIVINEIMYHAFPNLGTPGTPATYETNTILRSDAVWRYNESGENLGTQWYERNFPVDGNHWNSGRGPLGNENEALPESLRTVLTHPNQNRVTTYYFQTEFEVEAEDLANASDVVLRHMIDDGVIIYLNGQEVTRFNMPSGRVTSSTMASATVNDAVYSSPITIPLELLQVGANVISAELHQGSSSSSDFVFGTEIELRGELTPSIPGTPFTESDEEWIELFNRGDTAIDVSGWELKDAIQFEIPTGTTIGPGEYLVIANDSQSLRQKYPEITVIGGFSGGLSNKDDNLVLIDFDNNPVDEVHYFERGMWPEYADGGGSSLELRDPFADNSKGAAWAASDEASNSTWREYSVSRVTGSDLVGPLYHEFIFGLLDSGEFLIDDISVQQGGRELMQNGSFSGDPIGTSPDDWRLIGNHSGTVIADPDDSSNRVLHVVAAGPQSHVHDHVETTFANNGRIANNRQYDISFRAKWLAGSNQINNRLYFTRIGNTIQLDVPQQNGTPGAANSQLQDNMGPTYANLGHAPILPSSGQSVTVSIDVQDPAGVASVKLWWNVDGGTTRSIDMTNSNGSTYRASIPGQSNGRVVQFYVEATDQRGAVSTFPAEGRESRALYQVGNNANREIDTLRLVMLSSDERDLFSNVNRMSNHYRGATLVYNNSEVYYDVQVRQVGSRFIRPNSGYKIKLNPEQKYFGVHDSIRIDLNGLNEIVYKQMINRTGGSYVSMYDDISYFISPRSGHTQTVLLNLARYEDDFLDGQFENGSQGTRWELDDVTYPTDPSPSPEGLKTGTGVTSPDMEYRGDDPEAYRGHLLIRNNRAKDDYSGIIAMSHAMSLSGDALYEATNEVMDVDLWMRHYATQSFLGNWDTYGFRRPKNLRIYQRPSDGKMIPLAWDFDLANLSDPFIYNGGATRLDEIRNIPQNTRLFWGHMWDLTNRGFNDQYISRWASHYGSLAGSNFSGETSDIRSRENAARSAVRSAIREVDFEITSNGGRDLSVNESVVTLRGRGWVDVRKVIWKEADFEVDVTWTSNDDWQIELPVQQGDNTITLEALDFEGEITGSDAIRVNSTVSNSVLDSLRISEINFNPYAPTEIESAAILGVNNDDFEFIEVQNIGVSSINLLHTRFDEGVDFTFSNVELDPGDFGVIVRDQNAFELRYPDADATVLGEYTGGLNNAGETLRLINANGETIVQISYSDNRLWPQSADGVGATLQLNDPATTPRAQMSKYYQWHGSTEFGGSPGAAGAEQIGIVINEVLAHTDPPVTASDSIELLNISDSSIDVSGWFVSDARGNLQKYRIPDGTVIGPNEFHVINESDFNPTPLAPADNHFALSGAHGDDVWLTIVRDGQVESFVDDVHFGSSANGEAFGRPTENENQLSPMSELTLGFPNALPRVGPIVLSEIHHSPADPTITAILMHPTISVDDLEYIEVHNPTTQQVDLTDWRLRGGIGFDFDLGTMLAPSESIVIVPFNPDRAENESKTAAFRAQYGMADNVRLLGGYSGQLRDNGERVELQRPDEPPLEEPEFIPHLTEDFVIYDDLAPWPNEIGMSINRLSNNLFGNRASSWVTAVPNPGTYGESTDYDLNGDGSIDIQDVDVICMGIRGNQPRFDLNADGVLNYDDVLTLVQDVLQTGAGDVTGDRIFDSSDLIAVFTAGEYEDGIAGNSAWSTGDWDCDGDFTTGDLVEAFRNGSYSANAIAAERRGAARSELAAFVQSTDGDQVSVHEEDEADQQPPSAPELRPIGPPSERPEPRVLDSLFEDDSEVNALEFAVEDGPLEWEFDVRNR